MRCTNLSCTVVRETLDQFYKGDGVRLDRNVIWHTAESGEFLLSGEILDIVGQIASLFCRGTLVEGWWLSDVVFSNGTFPVAIADYETWVEKIARSLYVVSRSVTAWRERHW